jgi:hemoglobin
MTRIASDLPPGLAFYRRTPEFTRSNVPAALLSTHTTKAGVWGLLRVLHGRVRYCLDSPAPESATIESAIVAHGNAVVIEPQAPHHVELLDADSTFVVEFHRAETPS